VMKMTSVNLEEFEEDFHLMKVSLEEFGQDFHFHLMKMRRVDLEEFDEDFHLMKMTQANLEFEEDLENCFPCCFVSSSWTWSWSLPKI